MKDIVMWVYNMLCYCLFEYS